MKSKSMRTILPWHYLATIIFLGGMLFACGIKKEATSNNKLDTQKSIISDDSEEVLPNPSHNEDPQGPDKELLTETSVTSQKEPAYLDSPKDQLADTSSPTLAETPANLITKNEPPIPDGSGGITFGNGGDGLLCGEFNGQKDVIMTNDHYELLENFAGEAFYEDPNLSIEERAEKILLRLKGLDEITYYAINFRLNKFFKEENIKYWDNDVLGLNDANLISYPKTCHPVRIVSQILSSLPSAKLFNINKKYWDALDDENKISLALHEAIYNHFIEDFGHNTSEFARYFNNMMISERIARINYSEYSNLRYKLNLPLPIKNYQKFGLPTYYWQKKSQRPEAILKGSYYLISPDNSLPLTHQIPDSFALDYIGSHLQDSGYINAINFMWYKQNRESNFLPTKNFSGQTFTNGNLTIDDMKFFYSYPGRDQVYSNDYLIKLNGHIDYENDSLWVRKKYAFNYTQTEPESKFWTTSNSPETKIVSYSIESKNRELRHLDSSKFRSALRLWKTDNIELPEQELNIDYSNYFSQNLQIVFRLSSKLSLNFWNTDGFKVRNFLNQGVNVYTGNVYFGQDGSPQLYPDAKAMGRRNQESLVKTKEALMPNFITPTETIMAGDSVNFNLIKHIAFSENYGGNDTVFFDADKPIIKYDLNPLQKEIKGYGVYYALFNGSINLEYGPDEQQFKKRPIIIDGELGTLHDFTLKISRKFIANDSFLKCKVEYNEKSNHYKLNQSFSVTLEKNLETFDSLGTEYISIPLQHLIYKNFGTLEVKCYSSKKSAILPSDRIITTLVDSVSLD